MKHWKKSLIVCFLALFVLTLTACGKKNPTPDPIGDDSYLDLSIRHADGSQGMVASASAYASKVGLDILKAGGNAFDAAVAVAFALGVTEPSASGIGGGGLLVGYDASNDELVSYNYREFVPGAGTYENYLSLGFTMSNTNLECPSLIGVPMFVDGMLTVLENHGTLSRSDVLAPSIDLARHGFIVQESFAELIGNRFDTIMRSAQENLLVYSSDGVSPITAGEVMTNEHLATTYEKIANQGRDGFYKGDIAYAIVSKIASLGGQMTLADLNRAIGLTEKESPLVGTYKNYDIVSMPPPSSGGISLTQFFNLIEAYNATYGDISELDHLGADYLHVVGLLQQLVYGDRVAFIADPKFADVPIEGLMSKEYATERLTIFNPLSGFTISGAQERGNPWAYMPEPTSDFHWFDDLDTRQEGSGSTSHFSVVDQWGNVVSSTNTINYFFGGGHAPSGTGFILNNTLTPIHMSTSGIHAIEPYKNAVANMSPAILMKDGEPFMSIGSPGSNRITAAIVQTILNIIEFDMSIQDAIEAPRVHHYIADALRVEDPVGTNVIDALRALGYGGLVTYEGLDLFFGGVQGIVIGSDGTIHGGADPRRDGKALGY